MFFLEFRPFRFGREFVPGGTKAIYLSNKGAKPPLLHARPRVLISNLKLKTVDAKRGPGWTARFVRGKSAHPAFKSYVEAAPHGGVSLCW